MTGASETVTFTLTAADPGTIGAYFGKRDNGPAYSVLIDRVEWVSGEPRAPKPRPGWQGRFDWATGRHRHALRIHDIRRAAWIEAGCPQIPMTIRTYIPRAFLEATP